MSLVWNRPLNKTLAIVEEAKKAGGTINVLTFQRYPVLEQLLENRMYVADISKCRDTAPDNKDIHKLKGLVPIYVTVSAAFAGGEKPFTVEDILAGDLIHHMIDSSVFDYRKDFTEHNKQGDPEALWLLDLNIPAAEMAISNMPRKTYADWFTYRLKPEWLQKWMLVKFDMDAEDWYFPEVQVMQRDVAEPIKYESSADWQMKSRLYHDFFGTEHPGFISALQRGEVTGGCL